MILSKFEAVMGSPHSSGVSIQLARLMDDAREELAAQDRRMALSDAASPSARACARRLLDGSPESLPPKDALKLLEKVMSSAKLPVLGQRTLCQIFALSLLQQAVLLSPSSSRGRSRILKLFAPTWVRAH
jgi:hypothetical protein